LDLKGCWAWGNLIPTDSCYRLSTRHTYTYIYSLRMQSEIELNMHKSNYACLIAHNFSCLLSGPFPVPAWDSRSPSLPELFSDPHGEEDEQPLALRLPRWSLPLLSQEITCKSTARGVTSHYHESDTRCLMYSSLSNDYVAMNTIHERIHGASFNLPVPTRTSSSLR